jgi:hypothetical protein
MEDLSTQKDIDRNDLFSQMIAVGEDHDPHPPIRRNMAAWIDEL